MPRKRISRKTRGSQSKSKNFKSSKKRSSVKKREIQVMAEKLGITKDHCKGHIDKKGLEHKTTEILDFYDIFCVIAGYKPIAAVTLEILNYATNQMLVNEITDLAIKNNIHIIANEYGPQMHIIAFPMKNQNRAILALYIYTTARGRQLWNLNHYVAGKLLGYSEENIKYFYVKNSNIQQYQKHKKMYKPLLKKITSDSEFKTFSKKMKERSKLFPSFFKK